MARRGAAEATAAAEAASAAAIVHDDNEWKIEVVPDDAANCSSAGGGGLATKAPPATLQRHDQLAEGLQFSHVSALPWSVAPFSTQRLNHTCLG